MIIRFAFLTLKHQNILTASDSSVKQCKTVFFIFFWSSGGLCPVAGAPGKGAAHPWATAAVWWLGHHGNTGVRDVVRFEPHTEGTAAAERHQQAPPVDEKRECRGFLGFFSGSSHIFTHFQNVFFLICWSLEIQLSVLNHIPCLWKWCDKLCLILLCWQVPISLCLRQSKLQPDYQKIIVAEQSCYVLYSNSLSHSHYVCYLDQIPL